MDAFDISRIPLGSEKQRYTSLLMQAGRLIGDWDVNFSQEMLLEDRQRTRRHVIGPYGSPDHGFRIENVRIEEGRINFDIHQGTIYLGGLRLSMQEVEGGDGPEPETYLTQSDWLQLAAADAVAPELAEGEDRFDLVFLSAWQQGVSAVEDGELLEIALGNGADTSTRLRNMRRVRIATGLNETDCMAAWITFCESLRENNLGAVNKQFEWQTDSRLAVGYYEVDDPDDLCAPSAVAGYLGAENQSIKVQLRGDNELIWGFDNAAPLYRVETNGNEIHLLTDPKDQHHWPLAGQIVEVLPWSAELANGEKVATRTGHLARVMTSYNPDTGLLTVDQAIPAGFGENWRDRTDADSISAPEEETPFFFLRVWRGLPAEDDYPVAYTPGDAVTLGNLGIEVTITGEHQRVGDFWVISARPSSPTQVLPWDLEAPEGVPPHGFRRFLAPLAIIQWRQEGGELSGRVIRDCRKTFRPLTDLEGCCTIHVGDGVNSKGDFDSLELAYQNLPPGGGKICVLPGRHRANLSILGNDSGEDGVTRIVQISGCGEQSIIEPIDPALPIFQLANVQNVTIEKLSLVQPQGSAIVLIDELPEQAPSTNLTIAHNRILAGVYGIYLEVDDEEGGENHFNIHHNQIAIHDQEGGRQGIFCLADEVRIERNKIAVVPPPAIDDPEDPRDDPDPPGGVFDPCAGLTGILDNNFNLGSYLGAFFQSFTLLQATPPEQAFLALGGIQLGGGSERVAIVENTIIGGRGHGISLGHVPIPRQDLNEDRLLREEFLKGRIDAEESALYKMAGTNKSLAARLAEGFRNFLYEINIQENTIQDMGLSGVSVFAFFDQEAADEGLIVQVEDLTVYRNIIRNCARQLPGPDVEVDWQNVGFGGIALASCEVARIEENLIEDNGLSFVDPVCGIYIQNGEDVEISRNRILNNGSRITLTGPNLGLSAQARPGNRAGIYIGMAFRQQLVAGVIQELLSDGVPAAKIHDNIVVQPLGQALYLMAFGPVTIVGNQFTSHEIDLGHPLSLVAGAVLVVNLGVSKDVARFALEPSLRQLGNLKPQQKNNNELAAANLFLLLLQYLPSGSVMFANNQTTLDMRNLEIDLALSAQAIVSLDDISYTANQSECKGVTVITGNENIPVLALDYLVTNVALVGMTVRTADSRFQEGFTQAFFSLISIAYANTTTGNQSSNCLFTAGSEEVFQNNIQQLLGLRDCDSKKSNLSLASNIGAGAPMQDVAFYDYGKAYNTP
ncbi:MAG: right-handed parallel beta-helix repeat-containing protein [Bacteroidota bacterium]